MFPFDILNIKSAKNPLFRMLSHRYILVATGGPVSMTADIYSAQKDINMPNYNTNKAG